MKRRWIKIERMLHNRSQVFILQPASRSEQLKSFENIGCERAIAPLTECLGGSE
jgi:hypothetical protein